MQASAGYSYGIMVFLLKRVDVDVSLCLSSIIEHKRGCETLITYCAMPEKQTKAQRSRRKKCSSSRVRGFGTKQSHVRKTAHYLIPVFTLKFRPQFASYSLSDIGREQLVAWHQQCTAFFCLLTRLPPSTYKDFLLHVWK